MAGKTGPVQPKKRLVVCCDGTYNNSVSTDNPLTNVARLSRCIDDVDKDGTLQMSYYHTGIGSGTSKWANAADAATGRGINHIVRNVYTFICLNFNPGDEIYLIGFSRGAYTVRCLASFIGSVGVLTKAGLVHINAVYKSWKASGTAKSGTTPELLTLIEYWAGFFKVKTPERDEDISVLEQQLQYLESVGQIQRSISIEACAVWDTVSALGPPKILTKIHSRVTDIYGMGLHRFYPMPGLEYTELTFVDVEILPTLKNVFHALALNERRKDFKPVIWADNSGPTNIKQCWFLGAHSDIGGGNKDIGLANITLVWMVAQLRKFTKLSISNDSLKSFLVPEKPSGPQNHRFAVHGHEDEDGSSDSKRQTALAALTKGLPLNMATGKITNSKKGKFVFAGDHHRSLEIVQPEKRKHRIWTPWTACAAILYGPFLGFNPVGPMMMLISSSIRKWKKNSSKDSSISTDEENISQINQVIHFSVRSMMAKRRASCLLLEKRKTEVIADASAAPEPRVVWRSSKSKGQLPKYLRNEVDILEEKACDKELELLGLWINQWTEGPGDPQPSTSATRTQTSTEINRFTFGRTSKSAKVSAEEEVLVNFLRPLLEETQDPKEMYNGWVGN